jgi:hypothetical protein
VCLSLDRKGQSRRAKFPKTVCVIVFLSFHDGYSTRTLYSPTSLVFL